MFVALFTVACVSSRSGPKARSEIPRRPGASSVTVSEQGEPAAPDQKLVSSTETGEAEASDSGGPEATVDAEPPDHGRPGEKKMLLESSVLDRCVGKGTSLFVSTSVHLLLLCKDDSVVRVYPVSIGAEGTPKRVSGDRKTPLGTYRLGRPRPSSKFHMTVPIGYPTPEQRRKGYTGGAIGLHGPRAKRSPGSLPKGGIERARPGKEKEDPLSNRNWTDGCLIVDSNREIEEIADWVGREKPGYIHIEGQAERGRPEAADSDRDGTTDTGSAEGSDK
jgi:hypothetical protein